MPYIRKWRKYRLVRVHPRGATRFKRRLVLFPIIAFLLIPTCIRVPEEVFPLDPYIPKKEELPPRPVPEPSTTLLVMAGLAALTLRRRRARVADHESK